MSVSSILAFVLAGAVAKVESVQVAKPSEDIVGHAVMKQMARELGDAKARIAELEDDVHRANVQFRRDQALIDLWRERAMQPQAQNMQALQQAQLAQYTQQAQQAQQALQAQQAQQGLLGAQNLIDAELWCNCVPSRSQVWAATEPE